MSKRYKIGKINYHPKYKDKNVNASVMLTVESFAFLERIMKQQDMNRSDAVEMMVRFYKAQYDDQYDEPLVSTN